MNKKLKIQFWKAEHAMAIQVLEHYGLENVHNDVLYGKAWTLNTNLIWIFRTSTPIPSETKTSR